jgi:hypothetical protein
LGPAVSTQDVLRVAEQQEADLVGVSYRLTPDTGERLLGEFAESADELRTKGMRFVFGGTPPVAERARAMGFFERVFDGSEPKHAVIAYLRGEDERSDVEAGYPQTLIERIRWKDPFPVLRHHFGLPSVPATRRGIKMIADASVLDVISLGVDQDAQENFFHPERQERRARGAGGVPVRSAEDYRSLYRASRRGNFPLLRTYSGTDDFIPLAELAVETIHNAWCAIPLFWFNQMDGRGPWSLEDSIREHQKVMRWYGERGIPVELNEPHHWGMRDAPDTMVVVSAYLSAYNAHAFGVHNYIAQMMFNSPPGLSDAMDLAKMVACLRITEPLTDKDFRIWQQTRTGLLSYPLHPAEARGHLAASVYLQMALKPHILHIVGHTEADHAATAEDVIEACGMASRAVENAIRGIPDMTTDPKVQARAEELVTEAQFTLEAIRLLADTDSDDPLCDPAALTRAVEQGILDAPHLQNNPFARGEIVARIDSRGACVSVNPKTGTAWTERERISALMKVNPDRNGSSRRKPR